MSTSNSPERAATPPAAVARGRTARALWMGLGMVLVGVGFVGLFVPLLPTTDFLVLALPCFARSSVTLERWLLDHPRVGAPLRAWREQRAVPRHAKLAACLGIAGGYGLFVIAVSPDGWLAMLVGMALLASAIWIVRRPRPTSER